MEKQIKQYFEELKRVNEVKMSGEEFERFVETYEAEADDGWFWLSITEGSPVYVVAKTERFGSQCHE